MTAREVSDSKLKSVFLLLLGHSYANDKLAKSTVKTVDLCEVNITTNHHCYNNIVYNVKYVT